MNHLFSHEKGTCDPQFSVTFGQKSIQLDGQVINNSALTFTALHYDFHLLIQRTEKHVFLS